MGLRLCVDRLLLHDATRTVRKNGLCETVRQPPDESRQRFDVAVQQPPDASRQQFDVAVLQPPDETR